MSCNQLYPIDPRCIKEPGHGDKGFPHETIDGRTWLGGKVPPHWIDGSERLRLSEADLDRLAKRIFSYLVTFNDPPTMTGEGKNCGEFVIPRIAEAIESMVSQ